MLPGPVCVALTPKRVSDVFDVPVSGADCVEVRLDYLDDPREAASVQWRDLPVPVIATCRGRERGGQFDGSIGQEIGILERAAGNGAGFVDIDYRSAVPIAGAEVIASCHDFDGTPDDVADVLARVCDAPGTVAKIATTVRSWTDNRRLMDLLARPWPKPVIVVGMGPTGEMTRVVGPGRGSALTFASSGTPSAPGQLGLDELVDTFRVRSIGPDTGLVGIVGNPVGHSRSPALHNRAFRDAGLDLVYLRFPVEDVGDFFANAEPLGIVGFSVTIPHKVEIMRYLDGMSREAASVGAVNTVYRKDGKWMGDNTDVHGIRMALKGVETGGARVVVLGSGGAARAAVAALDNAASITLLSRTRDAGRLEWSRPIDVDRIENYGRYQPDILINATPVGMWPDVDRIPVEGPLRARVVFDMVYNPVRTRLLEQAGAEGSVTIPGTAMFLAQAARQFEIWTGCPSETDAFRAGAA